MTLYAKTETFSDVEVEAELEDGKVVVYQDGHWAGEGRWVDGRIVDCAARLGADDGSETEDAYRDLEEDLAAQLAKEAQS